MLSRAHPRTRLKEVNSQVARHGRAARQLRRRRRRPVRVRIAVARGVHEPERARVVEKRAEHRAGVEQRDLVQVAVRGREAREGRGELRVVVRERALDERGGGGALLDEQRGAVRGRHGEKEEGTCTGGVERVDLDERRGQPERASFEMAKPACWKSRVMSFLWKSVWVTLV